jgi:hypothetical protein
MENNKFVINVYVGGSVNGKQYNNFKTGEPLLFDNEKDAEKFALNLEEESSKSVWCSVVPYDVYKELPPLFEHTYK